jgi:hypothetical protein
MMRLRRNASILAITTALLLSATGCGGGDEPTAEPTAEPTETSTSDTPTESPSPTESAWQDKYSKKQLDGYEAALTRWEIYETRSEPIWAAGKVTERAEALFKQYFPSPVWQGYYDRLKTYQQVDVQVEGTPGIYWSRAKGISKNGRSVVIDQCVDYTTIKTMQRGEPATPVAWQQKPNLRTITLEKPTGYDWLIYGVVDASGGKARPCEP